ncbi:MAG: response regulator transcription factor [Ignavibacteriae bacterium]|nr:response regulator transcription factor [Ignavibacteriota bacterium]
MKYFIIDDFPDIRTFIKDIIMKSGDEVYEFDNALNLVPHYEQYKPDWICMDINMEPMNGIQATSVLLNKFPDARVIIVTNYNEILYRTAAINAGVHAYILKDDLHQLLNIIHPIENSNVHNSLS